MQTGWQVTAETESEIAICRAPGFDGTHPPRLIRPEDMSQETRGSSSNTRHICNILPETEPARFAAGGGGDRHRRATGPPIRLTSMIQMICRMRASWKKAVIIASTLSGFCAATFILMTARWMKPWPQGTGMVLVPRGYHPVGLRMDMKAII